MGKCFITRRGGSEQRPDFKFPTYVTGTGDAFITNNYSMNCFVSGTTILVAITTSGDKIFVLEDGTVMYNDGNFSYQVISGDAGKILFPNNMNVSAFTIVRFPNK